MTKWIVSLAALCGVAAQAHAQSSQTAVPAQTAPQAQPRATCTRQSLQTAVDSYLAAQKAGDRKKMALADKAKYLENMNEVARGQGPVEHRSADRLLAQPLRQGSLPHLLGGDRYRRQPSVRHRHAPERRRRQDHGHRQSRFRQGRLAVQRQRVSQVLQQGRLELAEGRRRARRASSSSTPATTTSTCSPTSS